MNDAPRGSVIAEEAYALGKMLDHSSWQNPRPGDLPLPRKITPADLDISFGRGEFSTVPIVLDNNGQMLLCELSSHACEWGEISVGQKRFYSGLIQNSPHCAVVLHHSVRPEYGRKIDTRYDIDSIHIRIFDYGFVELPPMRGNYAWQRLVLRWFENPVLCRRLIIRRHLELALDATRTPAVRIRPELLGARPKLNPGP